LKRVFSILKYLSFFAIGVFLLWLAFANQDQEKIIQEFKNANYFWVGVSLCFMTLSHISRGIRWTYLIKPLGVRVSPRNGFIAVMVGYLANLALPRMGEITRCVILNRSDKVSLNSLIGTVVVERIFDMIVLLTILIATFLIEFDRLNDFYFSTIHPNLMQQLNNLASFEFIGLLVATLALIGGVILFIRKKYRENPIIAKLRALANEFVTGFNTIKNMENNLLFFAHTIFIWVMYWAMTYVVFFALESTSHLTVMASLTAFSVGSIGFIMPVQGGIGTYHWAVKEGLKLYDLPQADGLTYATLVHGSQFLATLFIGVLCFITFALIKKKALQNEQSETT